MPDHATIEDVSARSIRGRILKDQRQTSDESCSGVSARSIRGRILKVHPYFDRERVKRCLSAFDPRADTERRFIVDRDEAPGLQDVDELSICSPREWG